MGTAEVSDEVPWSWRREKLKSEQVPHLRSFIAARLDAECAAGWSTYRRFPSKSVQETLVYFAQLSPAEWLELRDDMVAHGLYCFVNDHELAPDPARFGVGPFVRYCHFTAAYHDWALETPSSLKNILLMLDHGTGRLSEDLRRRVPAWVVEKARAVQLAKAADVRRAMKPAFALRFGAKAKNFGDGIWLYRGECGPVRFEAQVDFDNYCGFRYLVSAEDRDLGVELTGLSFAGLCGLLGAGWDSLTKPTIDQHLAFLMDDVERLCRVPREWHDHLKAAGVSPT